ncbi:XdhC/CoxI family protein [Dinoroseobacter sp. PD6]|uniref:XdhC family protein n=1 Tax=Dinoroseobacter sp. PD6 TaxID=3028384 RepID=UPI00237BF933|nr:XdhC/CoxI family protein [Dinoroseobacter sp. PD6]MDD9716058.1 XdhC/CoxI family protein [Dinoroseobacter sp. PD6]
MDPLDRDMEALRAEGRAFAVATVVRTLEATSAKPGAKALISAEGEILAGWVGGGCIRAAVGRAAREAVADGATRFLSLRPEEVLEAEGVAPGEERAGIRFARNGCPSKGSMDVFIEPVLPRPVLQICGGGPVAQALARLGAGFDFDLALAAPGLAADEAPAGVRLSDSYAFDTCADAARFLVVATQGKGDEAALRAALSAGGAYVAFVGSRRKFATLRARLAADGVPPEALDRVKAPAGLDIKAITPEEIALSILAEIVATRRSAQRDAP